MLRQKLFLLLTITLSSVSLFQVSSSIAQTSSVLLPSQAPLELDLLTKPKESIITANTINLSGLTTPSLWWAKENSENKLLDNWIAYPASENEAARVDLIVNQQIWSLLDYLERYDFVNRLGNTVRRDAYNVRVFNYQKDLLGTYTCSFTSSPVNCNIQLNTQYKLRRYQ
ncbi:hypothetical protein [Anabaena subtropica]|uniref:Uncharacterized protein n=1 Tax=Anabaena subtropica FACHB-260 TaxID=2692884 RepID=A0ABR8CR73_9NOST|nr:hypothetical protein [Anabaena subtropica]MBD2345707.1 hypothetical protein [Anabaena subtropica FACHB-260]